MKLNLCLLVVGVFLACQATAPASGTRTPEQGAIMDVINGMKLFEGLHEGRAPTNWTELSETLLLDKVNQPLLDTPGYPIEQHYVFVTNKIPVPDYEKGDVVLIRVGPIPFSPPEQTNEGRFVISRFEGALKFNWLAEDKVQQMLTAAGVTELPKPEPWNPPARGADNPPPTTSVPSSAAATPKASISNQSAVRQTRHAPPLTPGPSVLVSNEMPADLQPEQAATDSSLVKWPVIVLVAVVGLVFAFVLLRRK